MTAPTAMLAHADRQAAPAVRLRALDVSRGAAMLCVCLAHFVHVAIDVIGLWPSFIVVQAITMVASPAFMLLSGMTLGYTFRQYPARFDRFAAKLRERGLFLLTVAHLLIIPSHVLRTSTPAGALRTLFITDAIAAAILLGPAVVRRTSARSRVVLGAALVAITWLVLFVVPPGMPSLVHAVVDALFGSLGPGWWEYAFPIVPWFAVYLTGTAIGERLGAGPIPKVTSPSHESTNWLSRCALTALGLALALGVVATLVRTTTGPRSVHSAVIILGDPFSKLPPSPMYLLMYSGLALVLARLVFAAVDRVAAPWLLDRFTEIGQASLFVFVLQYFMYYIVEMRWPPYYPRLWPLYFAGSFTIVMAAAHLWARWRGNRFLRLPFAWAQARHP